MMKHPSTFTHVDAWHQYVLTVPPKELKKDLPELLNENSSIIQAWYIHYLDYHLEQGANSTTWKKGHSDRNLILAICEQIETLPDQQVIDLTERILLDPTLITRFKWHLAFLIKLVMYRMDGLKNCSPLLREHPLMHYYLHKSQNSTFTHGHAVINEYALSAPFAILSPTYRCYVPQRDHVSILREHSDTLQEWMSPERFQRLQECLTLADMDIPFHDAWDNTPTPSIDEITLAF